jgi:outer membrane protein assembly factor BamB
MRRVKIIEDCNKFSVSSNGSLVYLSRENIFYNGQILGGAYFDFKVIENKIYTYNNSENKTQFFDIVTKQLVYENDIFLWIRNNVDHRGNRNIFFGQYESSCENCWVDIDAYNFNIIKKYKLSHSLFSIITSGFLFQTENALSCEDLNTGIIQWQKEFSEKITGDILVYEDKLLVSLSEGDFICLDQSTGEEIWRCEGVYGYRKIIENNYSYEFAGDYFSIVDLKKGCKEKEINLKEINDKEKLFPISAEILKFGNRIYFISGGIPRYIPAVGSFNLETQTYDWLYRFDNLKNPYGFSGMNCLQYHDGLLYVLTNDNTLHIFEEET